MKRHILLVQDNNMLCKHLRRALELEGHLVTIVSVASVAQQIVRAQKFDSFIVGLALEDGDSRSVLQTIQKIYPKEKVMIYTADELEAEEQNELLDIAGSIIQKGPSSIDSVVTSMR